jgi:hypothetical protein
MMFYFIKPVPTILIQKLVILYYMVLGMGTSAALMREECTIRVL